MFEVFGLPEYVGLVEEYAMGWEEGLSQKDWSDTTIEEIREAVKLDGNYEKLSEREFATFCEDILRKVHEDGNRTDDDPYMVY